MRVVSRNSFARTPPKRLEDIGNENDTFLDPVSAKRNVSGSDASGRSASTRSPAATCAVMELRALAAQRSSAGSTEAACSAKASRRVRISGFRSSIAGMTS